MDNPNGATSNMGHSTTGARLQTTERLLLASLGLGLMALGTRGGNVRRLAFGGAGALAAVLAARGSNPVATAMKIQTDSSGETRVSDGVTIGKPAAELYAVWRNLENLPNLMRHLQEVKVLDDRRSHWTVKGPLGEVSWDAELTADEPGKRIAWQSVEGASIENGGEVLFRPAPGARGTEIVVRLHYRAPLGSTGAVVARALGEEPSQQLRDDLMRFKREQELGFHPTTEGQTSGRAAKQQEDRPQAQPGGALAQGGAR
ncbi:SRPBCC family protein [Deinococcus ruber]|uniref:Cyclase n=1 Tax=Deinococcus ruber TaxID=1848197 RepID=A0A918F895_9DEIO|nr:SRPBCC family protein [Deinococcus ruber]GGR18533.1 cyclase [Deinococcus ruber]